MLKSLITALLLVVPVTTTLYDFTEKGIDGEPIPFASFKGKKVLIVNTASECGYTPQYKDLQKLYETYHDRLVIIAFPANNFGEQEPGTDAEIKQFCSRNYAVTFPVAARVSVKGDDISPFFKWLTEQPNPDFTGDIKWNFEKFLFDENGKLIRRYRSKISPVGPEITEAIKS